VADGVGLPTELLPARTPRDVRLSDHPGRQPHAELLRFSVVDDDESFTIRRRDPHLRCLDLRSQESPPAEQYKPGPTARGVIAFVPRPAHRQRIGHTPSGLNEIAGQASGAPGGRTLNQRIKSSTLVRNACLTSTNASPGCHERTCGTECFSAAGPRSGPRRDPYQGHNSYSE
jgi:hypothetical protein